jgi:hypothetical protein
LTSGDRRAAGHTLPNGAQREQSANGPAPAYGVEEVGVKYGLENDRRRSVDYPVLDAACIALRHEAVKQHCVPR